jgi:hypothetical protein
VLEDHWDMIDEITDKRSVPFAQERRAGSLGLEIVTDIALTGIGTGLVALAILLAAQGLSVS